MVVVEAITIGFRQLLNVLHTVPATVSCFIVHYLVYEIGSTEKLKVASYSPFKVIFLYVLI